MHETIKAGWRPLIGWICALAFAFHYLVQPVVVFILLNLGVPAQTVEMDTGDMMGLLFALLGLGGLRTAEKIKNKD